METSNLPEAEVEFKTLVMRILNELRERVHELSKTFNKEIENIKGNQSEMKNTIFNMKRILEEINTVDEVEDRNSNLEDRIVEDTQSGQQQEKKIPKE